MNEEQMINWKFFSKDIKNTYKAKHDLWVSMLILKISLRKHFVLHIKEGHYKSMFLLAFMLNFMNFALVFGHHLTNFVYISNYV